MAIHQEEQRSISVRMAAIATYRIDESLNFSVRQMLSR
jgi:hypothetical protein